MPCPHFIRDYCREFFVSKGMIADFAIRQEKKKAKYRGRWRDFSAGLLQSQEGARQQKPLSRVFHLQNRGPSPPCLCRGHFAGSKRQRCGRLARR